MSYDQLGAQAITELIRVLELTAGPDIELDAQIWCWVRGYQFIRYNFAGNLTYQHPTIRARGSHNLEPLERYTSSVDAALTLIPEGWYLDLLMDEVLPPLRSTDGFKTGLAMAKIQEITRQGSLQTGRSWSLPLALCVAALRARAPVIP